MDKLVGEVLSEGVLARELGRDTVAKGRRVLASGAVRSLEVSGDGASITASVASAQRAYRTRAPYQQTITIPSHSGRRRVVGYCTCPMAHNCKHVAAALLMHLARSDTASQTGSASAARTELPDKPRQPQPPAPELSLSSEVAEWLERLSQAVAAVSSAASGEPAARATGNARALLYVLLRCRTSGLEQHMRQRYQDCLSFRSRHSPQPSVVENEIELAVCCLERTLPSRSKLRSSCERYQ